VTCGGEEDQSPKKDLLYHGRRPLGKETTQAPKAARTNED